jgi:hypothetical protein
MGDGAGIFVNKIQLFKKQIIERYNHEEESVKRM